MGVVPFNPCTGAFNVAGVRVPSESNFTLVREIWYWMLSSFRIHGTLKLVPFMVNYRRLRYAQTLFIVSTTGANNHNPFLYPLEAGIGFNVIGVGDWIDAHSPYHDVFRVRVPAQQVQIQHLRTLNTVILKVSHPSQPLLHQSSCRCLSPAARALIGSVQRPFGTMWTWLHPSLRGLLQKLNWYFIAVKFKLTLCYKNELMFLLVCNHN